MTTLAFDADIDVTSDICPITWVKTKLALEPLPSGAVLKVRMNTGEAVENVPRSAKGEGHLVVRIDENPDGTYCVWIEKEGRL